MPRDLVFYTHPMSRGRIVRWMLEEVGQPYRTEIMGYGQSMQSPEFLAINPMGKVPALAHGDQIVTEAGAICAYLADAFPEAGLAPGPTDPLRAPYLRWMFFAAGPVESAVTNRALKVEVQPQQERMVGYRNFGAVMDVLEQLVAGRAFIVGESFTAADVYLGSQIGWGLAFGTMEKRPAFQSYWANITTRPAYLRATQIDDAAMPKPA
jgi:glutathione S-transferase